MKKIVCTCCALLLLALTACTKEIPDESNITPAVSNSINVQSSPSVSDQAGEPSESDLASARKIAEAYLQTLKTKSEGHLAYSELRFDADNPMRTNYRAGISLENIIVFRADLDVDKAWSGFDAGKYTDWNIIITREDNSSEWKYTDAGY